MATIDDVARIALGFPHITEGERHASVNVYFSASDDDGVTFSPNVRVTTARSNEEPGTNINYGNQYGDYEGLDAYGGVAHPVWTDHRASCRTDCGRRSSRRASRFRKRVSTG